jgi:hypothetical protein
VTVVIDYCYFEKVSLEIRGRTCCQNWTTILPWLFEKGWVAVRNTAA